MSKKKSKVSQIGFRVLFFIFFGAIGFFGAYYGIDFLNIISFGELLFIIGVIIFSFPLHVILHEFGHILGGLISGYQFIMFRLFNTVWIKTEKGLSRRKEYVPGIMGQALMIPPEKQGEEAPPALLYHASGILMNSLTVAFFIMLGSILPFRLTSYSLFASAFVAILLGFSSAIPLQGTDGYNILQSFKHKKANEELIEILNMYHDMVKGVSLEKLQKYVDLDAFTNFKNPNATNVYNVRAAYLLETKDYNSAREIYETLYEHLEDLFEGHKPVVVLNYLYTLLLIDPTHPEVPKIIQSKTYKQFQKLKQSQYILIYAAKALYYDCDLKATEDLIIKGEKYIHLFPTLTDEHFEATMYQYLRVELNAMKQSV